VDRLTETWFNLANAHPFGLALVAAIGLLFIHSDHCRHLGLQIEISNSRNPGRGADRGATCSNLRDEAYKLSLKLQKRVTGYTVLNFVLVMIELLGSLFFAVTGLHGQFTVAGGEAGKIPVPAEFATIVSSGSALRF